MSEAFVELQAVYSLAYITSVILKWEWFNIGLRSIRHYGWFINECFTSILTYFHKDGIIVFPFTVHVDD